SEDPPLVVLGLGARPDSSLKDSTVNIRRTGEFVVNMVDEDLLPAMVDCATDLPPGESEIPYTGLHLEKAPQVDVDRIVEAPLSFACRQVTVMQFGNGRDLAIGEIQGLTARPGVIDPETLRVNWDAYHPVGRLFATHYVRMGERISMTVPQPEELRRQAASDRGKTE
ncbi:MAG: flavin reductase family protein, partial [Pseudomonadota bacterium]